MSAPVAALFVACALVAGVGTAEVVDGSSPAPTTTSRSSTADRSAVHHLIDDYVDPDGRVVRRDQGGDTVSEGQAYAMLVYASSGDHDRFDLVWRWTVEHLQRDDRLLSWHWRDGAIVDPEPATDADLDAAHALLLAAERFDDDGYRWQAAELASAILDRETIVRDGRRLLLAGPWAGGDRPVLNPSYLSPLAAHALAASDDRWRDVLVDGRGVLDEVADPATGLVSDWAIHDGGRAAPSSPPRSADPPRFGYDAARSAVRSAIACDAEDRAVAAAMWPFFERVVDGGNVVAVYDLDGAPATSDRHPLMFVAAAAAAAAAGQPERVDPLLDAAARVHRAHPTYYGAAWLDLGRELLLHPSTLCAATSHRRATATGR